MNGTRPAREPRTGHDGLLAYFGPAGWWTQWYWPAGSRGKVWNWLHGRGWRIT